MKVWQQGIAMEPNSTAVSPNADANPTSKTFPSRTHATHDDVHQAYCRLAEMRIIALSTPSTPSSPLCIKRAISFKRSLILGVFNTTKAYYCLLYAPQAMSVAKSSLPFTLPIN